MTHAKPPLLLPAGVLARRLGVTARWLLDEHAAGRLPGVRTDRTVLFEPDVVENALLARARDGEDPEPAARPSDRPGEGGP